MTSLDFKESEDSGGQQSHSDPQDDVAVGRKRRTQVGATATKKCRTAYETRRENKSGLKAQVAKLQKHLDGLKYQVLVQQGEAAKSNDRTAAGNSVLLEFVQKQHVELAKMQAMLAGHLQQNIHTLQPAQTIIRLGTDRTERLNVLRALKEQKLQEAKRFIAARSGGLDPRAVYSQEERNTCPGKDYCLVVFESSAVHGVSARNVFEAFVDVAQNEEIVMSEMFGSITVRENHETDARDLSQMRLVTSTSMGTLVESNTVMFTEFREGKDDKQESYGLVVADFVDSDKLYPYKPEERVRRDTTTVFMIRSYVQQVAPPPDADSANSEKSKDKAKVVDEKGLVVVATRWTCSKIRRSQIDLSANALRELQESTVSFGDTMKKCLEQRLGIGGEANK